MPPVKIQSTVNESVVSQLNKVKLKESNEEENMKSKKYLISAFLILGALALAASVMAADSKAMEYRGDIIDGMCLAAHQDPAALKEFVPTHTKECVLKPECRKSGMNLYQEDGTVLKFDKASDKKIISFLDKKDSKLQVIVTAKKKADNTYSLVSIKNQ
jgi:hypothetical protein